MHRDERKIQRMIQCSAGHELPSLDGNLFITGKDIFGTPLRTCRTHWEEAGLPRGIDGEIEVALRRWSRLGDLGFGPKYNKPFSDDSLMEARSVRGWVVDHMVSRQTVNWRHNSYGIKHTYEYVTGRYVTNGAFILGAALAGVGRLQVSPGSPNAVFGWSEIPIRLLHDIGYRRLHITV